MVVKAAFSPNSPANKAAWKCLRECKLKFDRRRFLAALAVSVAGATASLARAMPMPPPVAERTPIECALAALARHASVVAHRDVVGIVDFTAPSHLPRFHLVNVGNGITSSYLVAHGKGSDPENSGWVERLSNEPGSNASSGGSFLTGDIYVGKHGRSRRLVGLEPVNNLAADRGIVIHAASYVDVARVRSCGRIGRSQGCFAVSNSDISEVLDRLGPGRLLFAWTRPRVS
jgi:hypothetical protein